MLRRPHAPRIACPPPHIAAAQPGARTVRHTHAPGRTRHIVERNALPESPLEHVPDDHGNGPRVSSRTRP